MATKPKGWFSRRHQTDEANQEARIRFANRASRRPKQTWVEDPDHQYGGYWVKENHGKHLSLPGRK